MTYDSGSLRKTILMESPLLLLPNQGRVSQSLCLGDVFSAIFQDFCECEQRVTGDEVLHITAALRACIAANCLRRINSNFEAYRISRKNGVTREMVEKTADLWMTVWRSLERMDSLNLLWNNPCVVFHGIIYESVLVTPFLNYACDHAAVRNWYSKTQPAINKALQNYENPFDRKYEHTFHFVGVAQCLAEKTVNGRPLSPDFAKEYYTRMIKERKALIVQLRNNKPVVVSSTGTVRRQGRRSDLRRAKLTDRKAAI